MSAIARFFLSKGVKVSGYDRTLTPLTKQLATEGALISYADDISLIDKHAQLVVFTPAIPKNLAIMNWYNDNGYQVVKRSDVLQVITADTFNICIAGTHGKTSISTMVGHILRQTGYGCNAFLGGVSVNYNTNFWGSNNEVCVVEADEFDRSFLKLSPDIAVVSAMDADHLDIYGTVENMQDAFVAFTERIKPGGLLIRKNELQRLNDSMIRRQLTYKLQCEDILPAVQSHEHNEEHHHHEEIAPDICASDIKTADGGYTFNAHIAGHVVHNVHLNVGGLHNIENMLAAIAIAKSLKIDDNKIKDAVADYKGVKRRFEYLLNKTNSSGEKLVVIDDYAHHPEELRALLTSARHLFGNLRCTVVFQPHLFSRTRDLAGDFASALSLADEVVLLPVYPARELPIAGVTSQTIAQHMEVGKVKVMEKTEWLQTLHDLRTGLLITAGAGDIDALLPQVVEILTEH